MNTAPNHKHFTRGGQIAFHNLRMLFQINKALFTLHCISWVIISLALIWYTIPKEMLVQVTDYETAKLFKLLGQSHVFNVPYSGGVFKQSVYALTTHPYYPKMAALCFHRL